MFAIAIKNLEVRLNNSNLPTRKKVIYFEPLTQKRETDKQTAGALYYKY